MSILDRARAGQNALEKIANSIPGFRGYREKELRRDADRLQREFLASGLEDCKKALDGAAASATRSGSLDLINDVETARKRLDRVIARIRYADRGYAGFFDTVKVEDDILARAYEFDLALLVDVDGIRGAVPAAEADADAVKAGLGAFVQRVDALETRLKDREAILSGMA